MAKRIAKHELQKKNILNKTMKPDAPKKEPTKIDILEDSVLTQHFIVKDLVNHETDFQGQFRSMVQFLPLASRESYIESLIEHKLPN